MTIPPQPFVEAVLRLITNGLQYIADHLHWPFHISLNLQPSWKYFFGPMWLYFGRDGLVSITRKPRRPIAFAVALIFGGSVALLASALASNFPIDDMWLLPTVFPIIGFVVYELGQAVSDATFHRYQTNTFRQQFSYYFLTRVVPNVAFALVIMPLGIFARWQGFSYAGFVVLTAFILFMASRDLVLAVLKARENRTQGQSVWNRVQQLASWKLSMNVFAVFAVAAAWTALNDVLGQ
jgi:hypothetical protein